VFQGRGDIIDKIKDYVIGNSNVPFILHGESGCGKTSLTAKNVAILPYILDLGTIFRVSSLLVPLVQ
jgi:ABC-type dipeptide/oligopeptide/nickel transport system ATPase subunit